MLSRTSYARVGRRGSRSILRLLPFVGFIVWAAVLLLAQASGRMEVGQALSLLAFPVAAVGAMVRPAWVVLILAAIPVGQIQIAPTKVLILLLLVTLGCQLVVRGSVSVGWRSGFVGLIALLGASVFFRADLTANDALAARGFLAEFTSFILLGLVSYNATRIGDLQGRHLINAILLGLTLSLILEYTVLSYDAGILGSGSGPIGRPTAYLAAVGFTLCFGRLITRTEAGDLFHPGVHILLAIGFLLAMIPGLDRGAWLSALLGVLVISQWTGKKGYLLIIPLALMVMLTMPAARDRIVPNEGQSGGYTTGRLEIWTTLWDEIEPALPLGNGFGHSFTITWEEVFGPAADPHEMIYPHNDFMYWMVELGLLGLMGMLVFWSQLLRAARTVSRSGSGHEVYVRILSGVLMTGLVTQLVASTFFFLPFAHLFFIVAGFVFGAREAVAEKPITWSRSRQSWVE